MAIPERLNPSLFDKLSADLDMPGLREDSVMAELSRDSMKHYSVPRLERFTETALKETIKRDLYWLLNTVSLSSGFDLSPYPQIKTSVLNYGVTDLAGKSYTQRAVAQRARDIQAAVKAFEPRINPDSLHVEPSDRERENRVTYVIHGDITAAVQAIPINFKTDVEADSATVTIRD